MQALELFFILTISIYVAWKFSSLAARLNRTHIRRDIALNSLRQHLALRGRSVAKLISLKLLDEDLNNRLLNSLENVLSAAESSFQEYLFAESSLTNDLCEIFESTEDLTGIMNSTENADAIFELARMTKRVQLARRFHNDAVGASQLLHSRPAVRLFRLAGHTEVPVAIDLDDRIPIGLQEI